jgi:hypothetical protein
LLPFQETVNACEREYQRAYAHCSGCQRGSGHWEVLCVNETCPVLYKREKYKRESREAVGKLEEVQAALLL